MPLRKLNAELLMIKGIEQKVSDFVIPDESLARAENVDFSKVGAAKKRAGFVENSNLVLGAGVLDEVRRLGVRQRREVLCITETVTQIGSAAGVGNAGDTLFSYSEETERWITRGKMPRPNLDVLWTSSSPAAEAFRNDFVCGGIGNYVCLAHTTNTTGVTRVVVFDVGGEVNASLREAPTLVIDTTIDTPFSGSLIGWAQAEGKVWLFYGYAVNTVDPNARAAARMFDPVSVTLGPEIEIDPDHPIHAVSSDGTNIYAAFRYGTGGYRIAKYDSDLTELASVTNNTVVLDSFQEMGLDARLGYVDLVRRDAIAGTVYVSRYTKASLSQDLANALITTGSVGSFGNLTICTVNETDAVILWVNANTTTVSNQPAYLSVGLIRMPTGALLGYFNHMGIAPYAQPFIIDGRVFFIGTHTSGIMNNDGVVANATQTESFEESFMCFQIPIDNMNSLNVPFPCAQWDYGRTVAKQLFLTTFTNGTAWVFGRTIYQDGTGVYVLTSGSAFGGQTDLEFVPIPRLTRLEFGDATHRWRHEEFHDYAAFAAGCPYLFDGTRTYELSTALHCPVFEEPFIAAGGSLPADEEIFFRAAMLYTDGNGRECWSQPSRVVSVVPTGTDLTASLTVMPVTTTMKPDMGNHFLGKMKLYLFSATRDAPNEYKVCAAPIEVSPYSISALGFSLTAPVPASNAEMYTSGFELDNVPAPPCRAMAVHSGRLFVIASDSNEVFYTKPFRADRGPEFGLGQQIPLPDKGTALASLNDRLAIFTHRSILAIGGDGPDVTGSPADAFSRPVLISPDYGCIEYCAVGRTPLGIIFRGQQGFYLLTMGFEVQYIGAQVEDITAGWQSTRSIVHDQKSACCHITGFTGERSEELCYWYDTKRWSLNLLASEVVDSVMLGDNLLVGVTDTTVAVASRYRLGSRAGVVSYQDHGDAYEQVLETGWLSFQQVGVFKRIWRVYALVRTAGVDATVRIQVWKDWEDRVSSDREFELVSQDTEPRNLRIHLKHQKLKAIKVRVTVTSEGAGVELMKVGFELGMRTGGPKEIRESTQ
jgi:hypothetical protein